ncbi:MAG: hypothetical protein ACFFB5_13615 [Promethearchaeota archaeon]
MENKASDIVSNKKSRLESINDYFSKLAEAELSDEISVADIGASIFLLVVNGLLGLYFIAHQAEATGFFTPKFSTLEMVLLYGILIYWITTSVLILIGQKHPSRNLDTYGGLLFASFAILWLLLVFPFDFTHFADVWQPEFLKFLVQWISNEIAWVLLVLLFIVHIFFTIFSMILKWYVLKAQAQRKLGEKNE